MFSQGFLGFLGFFRARAFSALGGFLGPRASGEICFFFFICKGFSGVWGF